MVEEASGNGATGRIVFKAGLKLKLCKAGVLDLDGYFTKALLTVLQKCGLLVMCCEMEL